MALIYVVEDDKSIQEIETFALSSTGYQTVGFDDAAGFYKALDKELPSLILLDIMLPDEDGLTILKKIRGDKRLKKTPVILLTAKGSEYDKVYRVR